MITDEQLGAIMPALPAVRRGTLLPVLQAAAAEFAITTPARIAAFLAQLAHESGQFRFMEELWGPTEAQRRYEPAGTLATRLGNTDPGDGKRFKGRGPIQITGRANYQRYGHLLGVDLIADPGRAAAPDLAFRIAGLFWSRNGLNELADRPSTESFEQITRRINGGLNGFEDRKAFYTVACQVLGVVEGATPRGAGLESVAPPDLTSPFERGDEAIRDLGRGRRQRTTSRSGKARKATSRRTSRTRTSRARNAGSTRKAAAGKPSRAPRRPATSARRRAKR
jgi:predicted chitinase